MFDAIDKKQPMLAKVKEKLKIENPKQENSEIEERFKEGN